MSKVKVGLSEVFLQARFNKEEWEEFDKFKEFYINYLRETSYSEVTYISEKGKSEVFSPIFHFPKLKEYEIWSEGTILPNGTRLESFYVGKEKGRNFAEACHKHACKKYLNSVHLEKEKISNVGMFDYDPEDLSYMGLKWYWSKELAGKSFG